MKKKFFDRFADQAACFAGSPGAFIGASLLVVIWAATGPFFKFSEVWQMVINTGTTLERDASAEEIASSFLFLATHASVQMTGQVLHPNGGLIVNG